MAQRLRRPLGLPRLSGCRLLLAATAGLLRGSGRRGTHDHECASVLLLGRLTGPPALDPNLFSPHCFASPYPGYNRTCVRPAPVWAACRSCPGIAELLLTKRTRESPAGAPISPVLARDPRKPEPNPMAPAIYIQGIYTKGTAVRPRRACPGMERHPKARVGPWSAVPRFTQHVSSSGDLEAGSLLPASPRWRSKAS